MSSPWDVESLEGRMMLSAAILQNNPTYVAFEAETPIVSAPAASWGVANSYPAGSLSGNSGLRALGTTGAAGQISFPVNLTTGGTYRLYIRGAYSSANDNSLLLPPTGGSSAATPSAAYDDQTDAIGKAQWHTTGANSSFTYTMTPGLNTLNIAPRESGYVIDRIILSTNQNLTPAQLDAMSNSPVTLDTPAVGVSTADKTVSLTWNPIPGAATYTVKRDGAVVASNITNAYFTDTTVTNGSSYNYTVQAINGTNHSDESGGAFAMPSDSGFVPSAPSITATGVNGGVQLSWFPSFGATSYDVWRGTSSGTESFYKNVTDPGLLDTTASGTTYYYTVIAKNSHGDSSPSAEMAAQALFVGTGTGLRASFRSGAGNRDFTGPVAFSEIDTPDKNLYNSAPLFNPATFGTDNFSGRWIGQVQAETTDTYTLYITVDDGGRLFVDGAQVQLLDATGNPQDAWKDQGSTTYHWTAPTSWDAGSKHDIKFEYYENGGGADAELKWSTTLNTNPVAIPTSQLYSVALTTAPTITKTYVGNGSLTLDFSSLDNATGFNLYRSTTSGTGYQLVNTGGPLAISTARYVDSGLTNGTTYYYILKGINEFGEGPASAEASGTPSATATPVAPTALTAASTNFNQVTLNWTGVPFADDYRVLRSTTQGSGYTEIATGLTNTTYVDNSVTDGTTYYYVVEGHNANGNSPDSNEVKILAGQGGAHGNYYPQTKAADTVEPYVHGTPTLVRFDKGVNFDSGGGRWVPTTFNNNSTNNFTVAWTGQILADTAGTYTFVTQSDDAGYLWVDGKLVSWEPEGHGMDLANSTASTNHGGGVTPIDLTAGWHDFTFYMGEGGGGYGARINWITPGSTATVAVPTDHYLDVMSKPQAPTGLTANDNGYSIDVSFTDPSTGELGYKLQRSTDNGATWNTVFVLNERDATKLSDPLPLFGQTVQYRVVGFNNEGDGTPSAAITVSQTNTTLPSGLAGHYYYQGGNEPNFNGNYDAFRIDPTVNFNATGTTPWAPTVIPATDHPTRDASGNFQSHNYWQENFSTRWTGMVFAPTDGTYTFNSRTDDAGYLYVDDKLVSSDPGGHGIEDADVAGSIGRGGGITPIALTAGWHTLVFEYANGGTGNGAQLQWATPDNATRTLIPAANLSPQEIIPAAAGNFTVQPSDITAQLTWDDEANHSELGYTLERATNSNFSDAVVIANLPKNTTTYTDTGLTKATTYYYRLTSHNYDGTSPAVTAETATTNPVPPADPTNLYARALSGDKALVTWTDNSSNETHFSLERKDVTAGGSYAQIALLDPNTVRYTDADPNLVLGHTYSYRVIAMNELTSPALLSNYSNESSVVTVTNTLPAGWADNDIGNVLAAGSAEYDVKSGTFYVAGSGDDIWNNADAFNFVNEQFSGDFTLTARALITNGPDGWTKAGVMIRNDLSAGSQNEFMLISRDNGLSNQNRTTSGGASASVGLGHSSAQPVWVRLVKVGDSITGFWSDDGLTFSQLGPSVSVPMGQPVYVGLGLTAHHNEAGVLANAQFDNVTVTTAGIPENPSNVRVAAVTDHDVRVSWQDNSAVEAGYRVERATQANFSDAQLIATEAPNQTLIVDHNLNPGTTYYYRVVAFNNAGNSGTATGSGKTMTTAPSVKYIGDSNPYSDFMLNGSALANPTDTPTVDFNNYDLQLTANTANQTSSVFSVNKVDLTNFHFGFDLQMNNGAVADGMTFAIVGDASAGTTGTGNFSLGGGGGALGYTGITKSAALKFDIYNNIDKTDLLFNGVGADGDGGIDVRPSGVQFRSGHPLHVDVYYNSSLQALTEIITDLSSGNSFAHVYTGVDLPGTIGASTGYVGWTAATGGSSALQTIRDAEYDQSPISTTAVTGTGAAGNIYVNGSNGTTNFWINHDPTSTPADMTGPTASSAFSIDAKGGTVTIDLSNGQPIVPLGLTLSNIGTLRVIGGTGADTLVAGDGSMVLNGSNGLLFTGNAIGGIQFVGNGGADSLSFTGGTYALTSDPGAGGTLATLNVSNNGVVNVKSGMHLQSLNVSNTGQVLFDNVRGHTLVLANDLNLTGNAVLDLNVNDMVISTNVGATSTVPVASLSGTVAGQPNFGPGSTPGAEVVGNAIDGTTNKYLNFGEATAPGLNTGFWVTPSNAATTVTGLRLFTANDAPERDPSSYTIEGTNDDPSSPNATWTLISSGGLALPDARNNTGAVVDATTQANQEVDFTNSTAYKSYRVLFPTIKNTTGTANSMQIGEVQLMTAAGPMNLALNLEQKIQRYVANWSSNGTGPKLMASSANDASSIFQRTLAVADNANVQFSSFAGETFEAGNFNQILVKYTYFGDANLDGQVTPTDYAIVDGNIGLNHDWGKGDLNGDGNTTPADYALIDGNIGAGNGTANGGPQLNAVAASSDSTASASQAPTNAVVSEPVVSSPVVSNPAPADNTTSEAPTQVAAASNSSPFSTAAIHDNSDLFGSNADLLA